MLGIAGLVVASYSGAQGRFCATNDTFLFGNRPESEPLRAI